MLRFWIAVEAAEGVGEPRENRSPHPLATALRWELEKYRGVTGCLIGNRNRGLLKQEGGQMDEEKICRLLLVLYFYTASNCRPNITIVHSSHVDMGSLSVSLGSAATQALKKITGIAFISSVRERKSVESWMRFKKNGRGTYWPTTEVNGVMRLCRMEFCLPQGCSLGVAAWTRLAVDIATCVAKHFDLREIPEEVTMPHPEAPYQTYTVQEGDALWIIAKRTGFTAAQLASFNHLFNRERLPVGLTIKIPCGLTYADRPPFSYPYEGGMATDIDQLFWQAIYTEDSLNEKNSPL